MNLKDASKTRILISLPALIIFAIYLIIRIVMIVLTQGFDFSIYSRTLELNLWDIAWTTDLFMGIIGTLSASIFFKNKLPALMLLLLTTFSFYVWFIAMITTKNLTPIEDSSLKEKYAFEKQLTTTEYKDIRQLRVIIYKETFPLLYKPIKTTTVRVSRKNDIETITLFNNGIYEVSENENSIYFGSMKVPLE